MNNDNLCLGCMNPKGNRPECPKCGYVEGTPQVFPCLAPGTVLADRYLVGRHTGGNGEGYTYIGLDRKTGRKVDVREYMPYNLCTRRKGSDAVIVNEGAQSVYRDYLSDFIDIARAVSRLGDIPSIVPVLNIFECNGTAYAIYEHVDAKPLIELIKRAKRLTWDEACPLFMPLISSLSAAHAVGLVHFGISPETIRMTRSGELVLGGFGVPDARIAETELKPEMYEGFSAIEQYSIEAHKGKWTDVYALSAVLLYALTGKRPPNAVNRVRDARLNVPSDLADSIPAYVITAIAGGLQVYAENRTQSVDKLKNELRGGGAERPVPEPQRAEPQQRHRPPEAQRREEAPRRAPAPEQRAEREHFERPQHERPNRQPREFDGHRGAGAGFVESARQFGGRISSYISSRRPARRPNAGTSDVADGTPWYQNLKQWQYALLSTSITIVVLGTIAVIVFLSVRPEISGKTEERSEPTVQIIEPISSGDVGGASAQTEEVPDLVGKKWDTALETEYIVFQILIVGREYSDDQPVGYVIKQNVANGSQLAIGSPIGITVSLGSKMCKVPDITGKTVNEAYSALENAGLTLGSQTEEFSDSYAMGTVIRLNGTSVGASMQRGSQVSVVVSKGPES